MGRINNSLPLRGLLVYSSRIFYYFSLRNFVGIILLRPFIYKCINDYFSLRCILESLEPAFYEIAIPLFIRSIYVSPFPVLLKFVN